MAQRNIAAPHVEKSQVHKLKSHKFRKLVRLLQIHLLSCYAPFRSGACLLTPSE